MTHETIALAGDHAGFPLKQQLKDYLEDKGYAVLDLGTFSEDSVDYPEYGYSLAETVAQHKVKFGIAVCGSGIGISIAANRHPGARAARCCNSLEARLARQHNDANILAIGARLIGLDQAKACVDEFLATAFEGGRHQRRVDKLSRTLNPEPAQS